jgi:hypothetical protein
MPPLSLNHSLTTRDFNNARSIVDMAYLFLMKNLRNVIFNIIAPH